MYSETKMEMGRTYSTNERQRMDQTLHRVVTNEREEMTATKEREEMTGT